jgi:hypothetical protein
MGAMGITTQMAQCSPLPELETPMINTMVKCLGSEHRRFADLIMELALATARRVADPEDATENQRALEVWDELRRDLSSHLQIEDELIFSWGKAHHAISDPLLNILKSERQEIQNLMSALAERSSAGDGEQRKAKDRAALAPTLLALVHALDLHVERYESEILPSILRAVFHR